MGEKYIVRRRSNFPLVVIEALVICLGLAYFLCDKYGWDLIIGVVIFFGGMFAFGFLFFRFRPFRYIFSILFSLFWAFLVYVFVDSATKSETSPWIAMGVTFVVCLVLHKSYFTFERDATRVEYRRD